MGFEPTSTEFRSDALYDSQIVQHNPCFNLFILHNIPFDNQGSEVNKNDIFLRFDILSFTKRQYVET